MEQTFAVTQKISIHGTSIGSTSRLKMSRKAINARGAAALGPYSHVVAGDVIFLSGPTPIDPSTSLLVEGSIAQQTDRCLHNLFTVLDAVGLSSDDVIACEYPLILSVNHKENFLRSSTTRISTRFLAYLSTWSWSEERMTLGLCVRFRPDEAT